MVYMAPPPDTAFRLADDAWDHSWAPSRAGLPRALASLPVCAQRGFLGRSLGMALEARGRLSGAEVAWKTTARCASSRHAGGASFVQTHCDFGWLDGWARVAGPQLQDGCARRLEQHSASVSRAVVPPSQEFRDDVKKCLMRCGLRKDAVAFLLADSQIVDEQMVEAVSNVLNTGDVPNLYKTEAGHASWSWAGSGGERMEVALDVGGLA